LGNINVFFASSRKVSLKSCVRNKSEAGKLVLMNYGVKFNKKYGTRQIFTVTSEKSETMYNICFVRWKLGLATVY